jgi:HPr kinase/phosphorylase
MEPQSVAVEKFFTEHGAALRMNLICGGRGLHRAISEPTVNRPGLMLAGFTRYFAFRRIQIMGHAEFFYLRSLTKAERTKSYARLFRQKIPCIVFGRGLKPDQEFCDSAERAGIPVFQTPLVTMNFINKATIELELHFAPRDSVHGCMVDIRGTGVIIRGDSGIGKSESVLALIERGYNLVADDVVKITLVDGRDLMCTSSELTRDHMEVRGIGIINVARMFGASAIRKEKVLDLIVTLKAWDDVKDIDRLGLDEEKTEVLGIEVPHVLIPVRPGRDIARLIEVAALQVTLRKAGFNAADELNTRVLAQMAAQKTA